MARKPSRTDTLRFGVDAGLLFELGERLVTRPSIALSELIKNAYDADATQVTVLMENVKAKEDETHDRSASHRQRPIGSILIEDNGSGMTFEDVRDHWMVKSGFSCKRGGVGHAAMLRFWPSESAGP